MSVKVACPNCKALYKLPDESQGKKVKCAKCGEKFIATPAERKPEDEAITARPRPKVSAPAVAAAAPPLDDDAIVEDDEPAPAPKRRREVEEERPRKRREEPEEEEERPRKRRRALLAEDEDEDDRPRKRGRDEGEDEDEDDRPRKKKKAAEANVPLVIACMAGVFLLMGGTSAAIMVWSIKNARPVEERIAEGFKKAAERQQAEARFLNANEKVEVKGDGIPVKFDANGNYSSNNHLARSDPQLNNKYYKQYLVPLEKGKNYQFDMRSEEIDSFLRLISPSGQMLAQDDDGGDDLDSKIVYHAFEEGTYKLIATSFDFAGEAGTRGPFSLSIQRDVAGAAPPPRVGGGRRGAPPFVGGMPKLEVKGKGTLVAFGADGSFTQTAALAGSDPVVQGKRYKLYDVPMEQGKNYTINLNSDAFDSFLLLQSPSGQTVQADDDSGGELNSQITFTATSTGRYRVVATSLIPGQMGQFTLSVRRD
jgi:predicted Zn finger-like uncharacterized protein